tara:strand:+ start:13533 stop:15317 length:1785 start_codon:yes stop_codon:yes gene_type:complete
MEKITMFSSVKKTDSPHYVLLNQCLERISSGNSKEIIDEIRGGSRDKKILLPIALFSGIFRGRKDDDITSHSGLVILDFDHIDTDSSKALLSTDDYVRACWVSPSGDGLKVLVKITNPERHRDHFRALQTYFDKSYGLEVDPSGINESRACFESYDEDLISNDTSKAFGGMLSEASDNQTATQQTTYTDYEKLSIASKMIRKAVDGEKHSMLLRASILCGGYIAVGRLEQEEVERVLMREINKIDSVDDPSLAKKTIADGIAQGKRTPIKELIEDEKRIRREMLINDGDMSFISSDNQDMEWINKFANGDIAKGLSTGVTSLDNHFLFKKEFTIINGHSNVGKTTMAMYLIVTSAILHDWHWIIYSSENKTAAVKMKLMEFLVDIPIDQMHYEERVEAFKWVNDHFTIISNAEVYSYTDLIVFAEKLLKQKPYDGFLIDPYNSLKITMSNGTGLSSHEYHYEAASELLTFSNSNNIAVWLNTHAITEAARRKGMDGLQTAPFAEDTEGGGKMVNRSDCFLTFHRKISAPEFDIRNRMEVHVRKVRSQETGGVPTSYDQPILFEMNASRTGFRSFPLGKKSFNPLSLNSGKFDLS